MFFNFNFGHGGLIVNERWGYDHGGRVVVDYIGMLLYTLSSTISRPPLHLVFQKITNDKLSQEARHERNDHCRRT